MADTSERGGRRPRARCRVDDDEAGGEAGGGDGDAEAGGGEGEAVWWMS